MRVLAAVVDAGLKNTPVELVLALSGVPPPPVVGDAPVFVLSGELTELLGVVLEVGLASSSETTLSECEAAQIGKPRFWSGPLKPTALWRLCGKASMGRGRGSKRSC